MRAVVSLLALAVITSAACARAQAQADSLDPGSAAGRLVEELTIEGYRRLTDEEILRFISTRPGDKYDEESARRDLVALLDSKLFDAGQTRLTLKAGVRGGVVLIYTVTELPSTSETKSGSAGDAARDRWAAAHAAVVRLAPSAFPQLPAAVSRYLEARGCTVPQSYMSGEPHNVISGEFTRRGQTDWAVLCSRKGVSSILVFRRGLPEAVAEIAPAADRNYLQGLTEGNTKIGFSRIIEAVGRDYILRHAEAYDGPTPPPINHQGINDIFAEKASVVRYYHRGRWLELQGAD